MDPEKRLRLAWLIFWASLVTLPPAVYVTVKWPSLGVLILQVVSFLAITFTAWDIVQTADVRQEQDESE